MYVHLICLQHVDFSWERVREIQTEGRQDEEQHSRIGLFCSWVSFLSVLTSFLPPSEFLPLSVSLPLFLLSLAPRQWGEVLGPSQPAFAKAGAALA
jgi:hypothetical protein